MPHPHQLLLLRANPVPLAESTLLPNPPVQATLAVVARPPRRDEVWLLSLDPIQGVEMQKTRPCLVISPDEMNQHLRTVVIAPVTTVMRPYPTRMPIRFQGKHGQLVLEQIRAVDRQRLLRKLGRVAASTAQAASATLMEMLSPRVIGSGTPAYNEFCESMQGPTVQRMMQIWVR